MGSLLRDLRMLFGAIILLMDFCISGSLASYSNGKSRFQEFRGCNGTVPIPDAISQEDESPPSPSGPTTNPPTTSGTTDYPQNNYFQPVILGPHNLDLGTRMGGLSFGNNRLQITHPQQSFGYGNNEIKVDRVPTLSPMATRIAHVQQSVMALRNQLTGNRYFEMDDSIKFMLYTRKNPSTGQKIQLHNKDSIDASDFDGEKPTKLIIHGFSEIGNMGEWVANLRDAYLSTSEANVIIGDYSSYKPALLFSTNLPVFASKSIADLIAFLEMTTGTSREKFHLIARSYGTHVAGVTGRLLQGRVGRITGLEPEPKVYGTVLPDYKLVSSDAQFVDIVRVNGRRYFFHGARFGLAPPEGHVDIYPNFAERNAQCPDNSYGRSNFGYCQTGRGVSYFTETVKYPQSHRMCRCKSYGEYKSANCICSEENSRFYMGEYMSNKTRGVFQLVNPLKNPNQLRNLRLFG